MERLICLGIGYVFGLFQTGYIYGRMHGMDIRKHGSGNAGSTNALRTMGVKAGAITLLGDCFKCVIAVLVVRGIFASRCPEILPLLSMYAGFGAVLGHNYPFYLGFKGGKGIAATAGMMSCGFCGDRSGYKICFFRVTCSYGTVSGRTCDLWTDRGVWNGAELSF